MAGVHDLIPGDLQCLQLNYVTLQHAWVHGFLSVPKKGSILHR